MRTARHSYAAMFELSGQVLMDVMMSSDTVVSIYIVMSCDIVSLHEVIMRHHDFT